MKKLLIVVFLLSLTSSPLDKRLVSEAAAGGFFYGQPWTSTDGKAMAARVPKKGTPYPVNSNLIK